ncbi:MAG: hypothetical protein Q9159_007344 [Coniocarpon cinnabarinum]
MDHVCESRDHILFGLRGSSIDFANLHPEQFQIFKLWQIYMDNVNPLLKVIHCPTTQMRIIEAAGDVGHASPTLQALMFGIYSVAVFTLTERDSNATFHASRQELLARYQLGCQQALIACGFSNASDREALVALSHTNPRSLSSMSAVAIRIAQNMGIHNESANSKSTPFEAEMRRRLWWSLVMFDARASEVSGSSATTLNPTWDCRTPLNVNDFDLRPDMKALPTPRKECTDSMFAVVRSLIADHTRHSGFHLDFTNPILKSVARAVREGSNGENDEVRSLEWMVENTYLKYCNEEDPVHFVALWTARLQIAKNHLFEHYAKMSKNSYEQAETPRDAMITCALTMLECDTKPMTSKHVRGYRWYFELHFPFPAYVHLVQRLRTWPSMEGGDKAWKCMNDNYEARFLDVEAHDSPFLKIFGEAILRAWAVRDAAARRSGEPLAPPHFVMDIRNRMAKMKSGAPENEADKPGGFGGHGSADFSTNGPPCSSGAGPDAFGGESFVNLGDSMFPGVFEQAMLGPDTSNMDWTTLDWSSGHEKGW